MAVGLLPLTHEPAGRVAAFCTRVYICLGLGCLALRSLSSNERERSESARRQPAKRGWCTWLGPRGRGTQRRGGETILAFFTLYFSGRAAHTALRLRGGAGAFWRQRGGRTGARLIKRPTSPALFLNEPKILFNDAFGVANVPAHTHAISHRRAPKKIFAHARERGLISMERKHTD